MKQLSEILLDPGHNEFLSAWHFLACDLASATKAHVTQWLDHALLLTLLATPERLLSNQTPEVAAQAAGFVCASLTHVMMKVGSWGVHTSCNKHLTDVSIARVVQESAKEVGKLVKAALTSKHATAPYPEHLRIAPSVCSNSPYNGLALLHPDPTLAPTSEFWTPFMLCCQLLCTVDGLLGSWDPSSKAAPGQAFLDMVLPDSLPEAVVMYLLAAMGKEPCGVHYAMLWGIWHSGYKRIDAFILSTENLTVLECTLGHWDALWGSPEASHTIGTVTEHLAWLTHVNRLYSRACKEVQSDKDRLAACYLEYADRLFMRVVLPPSVAAALQALMCAEETVPAKGFVTALLHAATNLPKVRVPFRGANKKASKKATNGKASLMDLPWEGVQCIADWGSMEQYRHSAASVFVSLLELADATNNKDWMTERRRVMLWLEACSQLEHLSPCVSLFCGRQLLQALPAGGGIRMDVALSFKDEITEALQLEEPSLLAQLLGRSSEEGSIQALQMIEHTVTLSAEPIYITHHLLGMICALVQDPPDLPPLPATYGPVFPSSADPQACGPHPLRSLSLHLLGILLQKKCITPDQRHKFIIPTIARMLKSLNRPSTKPPAHLITSSLTCLHAALHIPTHRSTPGPSLSLTLSHNPLATCALTIQALQLDLITTLAHPLPKPSSHSPQAPTPAPATLSTGKPASSLSSTCPAQWPDEARTTITNAASAVDLLVAMLVVLRAQGGRPLKDLVAQLRVQEASGVVQRVVWLGEHWGHLRNFQRGAMMMVSSILTKGALTATEMRSVLQQHGLWRSLAAVICDSLKPQQNVFIGPHLQDLQVTIRNMLIPLQPPGTTTTPSHLLPYQAELQALLPILAPAIIKLTGSTLSGLVVQLDGSMWIGRDYGWENITIAPAAAAPQQPCAPSCGSTAAGKVAAPTSRKQYAATKPHSSSNAAPTSSRPQEDAGVAASSSTRVAAVGATSSRQQISRAAALSSSLVTPASTTPKQIRAVAPSNSGAAAASTTALTTGGDAQAAAAATAADAQAAASGRQAQAPALPQATEDQAATAAQEEDGHEHEAAAQETAADKRERAAVAAAVTSMATAASLAHELGLRSAASVAASDLMKIAGELNNLAAAARSSMSRETIAAVEAAGSSSLARGTAVESLLQVTSPESISAMLATLDIPGKPTDSKLQALRQGNTARTGAAGGSRPCTDNCGCPKCYAAAQQVLEAISKAVRDPALMLFLSNMDCTERSAVQVGAALVADPGKSSSKAASSSPATPEQVGAGTTRQDMAGSASTEVCQAQRAAGAASQQEAAADRPPTAGAAACAPSKPDAAGEAAVGEARAAAPTAAEAAGPAAGEAAQTASAAAAAPRAEQATAAEASAGGCAAAAAAAGAGDAAGSATLVAAAGSAPVMQQGDVGARQGKSSGVRDQAEKEGRGGATAAPGKGLGKRCKAPKICATCGVTEGKLRECAGCQSVRYCGVQCQRAHWRQHKAHCKELRAAQAAATGTGSRAAA